MTATSSAENIPDYCADVESRGQSAEHRPEVPGQPELPQLPAQAPAHGAAVGTQENIRQKSEGKPEQGQKPANAGRL